MTFAPDLLAVFGNFYYRIRTGDFDVAEKGFRRQMSRCLVTKAREWHSPYYAVNQDGEVKILDPKVEEADAVGAVFGPGGAHLVRDPGLADRIRRLDMRTGAASSPAQGTRGPH